MRILETWASLRPFGLVALAFALLSLIYLAQTSSLETSSYKGQRLEETREEWSARNQQIRLEMGKVRSLVWVEAEATVRLGMVRPRSVNYVVVGDESQDGSLARR